MIVREMDAEQIIAEIEWLELIFAVPDTRPLSAREFSAANRRHDEKAANSPWFRLWQRWGACCRREFPGAQTKALGIARRRTSPHPHSLGYEAQILQKVTCDYGVLDGLR